MVIFFNLNNSQKPATKLDLKNHMEQKYTGEYFVLK